MKNQFISTRTFNFILISIIIQSIFAEINYSGDGSSTVSRKRRSVTVTKNRIWDDGIIPYKIDDNYSGIQKTIFKQAMKQWENYTCIKFVERNDNDHRNYITFIEMPCGCCSHTGKRGTGSQFISINDDCSEVGYVLHELGHSIGFYHEHTRPDRDKHINILTNNIKPEFSKNFAALDIKKISPLTQPYDYDSIMHYGPDTFSKSDGLNTIIPQSKTGIDPSKLGQRIKLSKGDIIQANILYDCPKCGKTFQMREASFKSPSYESSTTSSEPEYCEWRISVAHGEKIIFTIESLNIYEGDNCSRNYLEVRDGYLPQSPILGHVCGKTKFMKPMVSTGNRMLIIYKRIEKDSKYIGFTARYKADCGGDVFLNNTSEAYLESPNYPGSYSENDKCIWRISVAKGYRITLEFQSFNLEYKNKDLYDYLEIRDGHKENSTVFGHYFGSTIPSTLYSSKNELLVKFVSTDFRKKSVDIGFSVVIKMIN